MDLITPGIGLIIWTIIVGLLLIGLVFLVFKFLKIANSKK